LEKLRKKDKLPKVVRHRRFFDKFANSRQFNPLDSQKWYAISKKDLIKAGGSGILNVYYKGSYIKALTKVYPELSLQKKNFLGSKREGKWKSATKCRKFFDTFAAVKQFNPLDSQKWYLVSNKDVVKAGGSGILNHYQGSHIKALIKLYPEISLQQEGFSTQKRKGHLLGL